MSVQYLSANWTNLRTSNSRIAGNFDSCQFIQVETSNSIIEGSFNLCHDGINPIPSILSLRTSYACVSYLPMFTLEDLTETSSM